MKKLIVTSLFLLTSIMMVFAEGVAEIKFEKTKYYFGTIAANNPKVTCVFKFKNVGDAPLVIQKTKIFCGCTMPTYPKEPIAAGKDGEIHVKFDGSLKKAGKIRQAILIYTNGKQQVTKLVIEGELVPEKVEPKSEKLN